MTFSPVTWRVEIAWDTDLTGLFRIASSTLGSGDVLDGAFGANVFEDVSDICLGFRTSRGRNSNLGFLKGTAEIGLYDPNGRYNPDNASSALSGLLVPLRPVRIRATHLSTEYGVWYGFTERIEHNPNRDVQGTIIYCVDLLELLEDLPTIASLGATTVGAAIGELLDAIEWTASSMRDLDTGDNIPDFSASGSKSINSYISDLLAVDRGTFFPDGSGVATYRDRTSRWKARSAAVSIDGQYLGDVKPTSDLRGIVNSQDVTRTGGSLQTYTDTTSRKKYGYRHGSPINSSYLNTDTQALQLAEFIVQMNKDPKSKTKDVLLHGLDDTSIIQQLTREISDLVTVSETGGNTSVTGYIEAIKHEVRGKSFKSEWLLSPRLLNLFTLTVSTLNSGDVLNY